MLFLSIPPPGEKLFLVQTGPRSSRLFSLPTKGNCPVVKKRTFLGEPHRHAPGREEMRHEHHSQPATEVDHVLSGRGRLLLDGEVHVVGAGDSAFIPGGTPHSVHVEGAEDLEFVDVSAADAADGPDTPYTMHEPPPALV